jgi:methionyl-tRNA formyltransferase
LLLEILAHCLRCVKIQGVKLRIVFMGTPEFAIPTLEKLIERYAVVGVITQPDRRAGRGRRIVISPIKEMALAEGIPVYQPKRLRNNTEAVVHMRGWKPDVAVVAAFGQILPASILAIPPLGVLNVHASLLPRWRGAAPIQGALLAGDTVTGVTIMKLDEGLDTGPVVATRETPIDPEEDAGALELRLAQLGADLLDEVLPAYAAGQLQPEAQPEDGVTITSRLRTSAAQIDWSNSAEVLHNHIRAFAPEPGAYTFWNGARFKIFQSQLVQPDQVPDAAPGTVFMEQYQQRPVVVTGEGCLALVRVQMAGKRPMDADAFVRGHQDFVGATLSS